MKRVMEKMKARFMLKSYKVGEPAFVARGCNRYVAFSTATGHYWFGRRAKGDAAFAARWVHFFATDNDLAVPTRCPADGNGGREWQREG